VEGGWVLENKTWAFDVGSIHNEDKWKGLGSGKQDFVGPCEMALSECCLRLKKVNYVWGLKFHL
jgi:hypothetical protein